VVVLDKGVVYPAGYFEIGLIKALEKKASLVSKNFGLEE
jgi:hypothetical protein